MFEQHPVPQQISSYQFRLVGDMTLKQFFQLAAGAVIGLIIYSLPIPGFLKWPFIALAVVGGAAFAFLPIQDRPLEQWLVAFFRSIYSPNLFYWKKYDKPVQYFASDNVAPVDANVAAGPTPQMEALPTDAATHTLETNEKNFLNKISTMFGGHTTSAQQAAQPQPTPMAATGVSGVILSEQATGQTQQAAPQATATAAKPEQITVPANTSVEIKPQGFQATAPAQTVLTTDVGQTFTAKVEENTQTAKFSPAAAPPLMPTLPNIIVGQVMDSEKNIVEGAILEITDTEGRPVRALKSNKAGHFQIVTSLPDGDYKISVEKEGLKFKPVTLHTEGKIVEPIAISAQNNG